MVPRPPILVLATLLSGVAASSQAVLDLDLPVLHPTPAPMVWDSVAQRTLLVSPGIRVTSGNYYGLFTFALAGDHWAPVGTSAFVDSLAHDPLRNRLVGMQSGSSVSMAEWNGTSWTYPSAPLGLAQAAVLVYDPTRSAVLVYARDSSGTSDLWTYRSTGFQLLNSGSGPPSMASLYLVPRPNGDVWLLGRGTTEQHWVWSQGNWTQLPAPPAGLFAVAIDPTNQQPWLVSEQPGGLAIFGWNGQAWALQASNGPSTGFGGFHAVHDGQRIVVRGGAAIIGGSLRPLGRTWAFANGTFSEIVERQPDNLADKRAAFDAARQRTVVVGMLANERHTTEWNGTRFSLRDITVPAYAQHIGLCYDRLRSRTVLQGSDGSTHEWDGAVWTTTGGPGFGPTLPRGGMAFDGQRVIHFGSNRAAWAYDGSSWTLLNSQAGPGSVGDTHLVMDERRGELLLFGDSFFSTDGYMSFYRLVNQAFVAVGPVPWSQPRHGYFVGFHPARGRVVAGGGLNANGGGMTDFWEWDGSAWHALPMLFANGVAAAGEPGGELLLYGVGDWFTTQVPGRLRSLQPASVVEFGPGCPGTVTVPTVTSDPWNWPWTGDAMLLRCDGVPPATTAILWALGFSNTVTAGVPLPLDLAVYGAPGCFLRASLDAILVAAAANGSSTLNLPVPPTPILVGMQVHAQAAVPEPGANAAGVTTSSAVTARIGAR
jgi:hypothetical protein